MPDEPLKVTFHAHIRPGEQLPPHLSVLQPVQCLKCGYMSAWHWETPGGFELREYHFEGCPHYREVEERE